MGITVPDYSAGLLNTPISTSPAYRSLTTTRNTRRAQTFFEDADYALYRGLLAQSAERADAQVWAYCLMPNHVHIIVVSSDEDGLRRTIADTHRRCTGDINARNRWIGNKPGGP